jgi:hypothetical protein
LIYLASPYTYKIKEEDVSRPGSVEWGKGIEEDRFHQVCLVAGELMKDGLHVFSPMAHTHPILTRCDLPTDWEFWKEYDEQMLKACKRFVIAMLPGWHRSKGVSAERKLADGMGMVVEYWDALGRTISSTLPQCNITKCKAPDAFWYNWSTRDYYCHHCAQTLNEVNPDAFQLYGHELCTPGVRADVSGEYVW